MRRGGVVPALLTCLLVAGCGGAPAPSQGAPASPESGPETSAPSGGSPAAGADGLPVVALDDAADPVAAGRHERDLVLRLRDDAGMAAQIGPDGAAALAALDAMTDAYAKEVLQAVAEAVDSGKLPTGARPDPLAGLLASTAGPPSRPAAIGDIDISLFADTGFTTSTMVSVLTGVVQQAAESNSGTISRSDSKSQASDGIRQQVDLGTTITIQTGGGRVTADLTLTATDNISSAGGSYVGLYTSTSTAHFDVSACPDRNGRAEGTYTFETRHELNDVSGASSRQSGAGRSVKSPFALIDGDDAKLIQVEASLDLRADARGPGTAGGPGPTGPFDWTATQQVGIVMPASGSSTWSGGSPRITGTGGEQAGSATFFAAAMAAVVMGQIGKEAERFWRSGKCINLVPSRDTGTVQANEQVDLTVESKEAFGGGTIDAPIKAAFSGKASLDPTQSDGAPGHFTFKAGAQKDDKGIIDLEQVSKRGIGKQHLEYTVASGLRIELRGDLNEPGADLTLSAPATELAAGDRTFTGTLQGRVTGQVDALGCSRNVSQALSLRVIAAPDEADPDLYHLFITPPAVLDPEQEITCQGVTTKAPVPVGDFGLPLLGTGPDGSVPVRIDQPTTLRDAVFGDVTVTVTLTRPGSGG